MLFLRPLKIEFWDSYDQNTPILWSKIKCFHMGTTFFQVHVTLIAFENMVEDQSFKILGENI